MATLKQNKEGKIMTSKSVQNLLKTACFLTLLTNNICLAYNDCLIPNTKLEPTPVNLLNAGPTQVPVFYSQPTPSLYEINKTPIQMPKMQNNNYYILNDINRNLEVIKNKLN